MVLNLSLFLCSAFTASIPWFRLWAPHLGFQTTADGSPCLIFSSLSFVLFHTIACVIFRKHGFDRMTSFLKNFQRLLITYRTNTTFLKTIHSYCCCFFSTSAAAAAKLLQSCPTLCDPIDGSPPGSPVRDSPGKNTGMSCHFLLQGINSLVSPLTVAHQAPLSIWFPRQEYWSGLPFPSPGDPPDQGIGPTSLALQADSLPRATYTTESQTYQIQHL